MSRLHLGLSLQRGAFRLEAAFEAPLDAITAVFGPSGAGKSLLLAALAGLAGPAATRIELDGRAVDALPPHRRGIGVVFQEGRLFPHLTVQGNLDYAARRALPGRRRIGFSEVVERFELGPLLARPVRNLSGGERNRVALARALLAGPELLLLDEPFAALDGLRRQAYLQALREIHAAHGLPMLVVTHQIEDAAALATHLIALQAGRVVAAGLLGEATQPPAFQALLEPRDQGAALPAQAVIGAPVWAAGVWLRADAVLVSREPPRGLSARNVWEARIEGLEAQGAARVLRLTASAGPLLARVTGEAAQELGLAPGGTVWAIVKAHAV